MKTLRVMLSLGVGGLLLLGSGTAATAPPPPPQEPATTDMVVERAADGTRTYRFKKGWVIAGARHKPNAFYVIERAAVRYDWLSLAGSFVDRIPAAVRKGPF